MTDITMCTLLHHYISCSSLHLCFSVSTSGLTEFWQFAGWSSNIATKSSYFCIDTVLPINGNGKNTHHHIDKEETERFRFLVMFNLICRITNIDTHSWWNMKVIETCVLFDLVSSFVMYLCGILISPICLIWSLSAHISFSHHFW